MAALRDGKDKATRPSPHERRESELADDTSEESTMDPHDVYIQQGDNRFTQVEGHPGTVAWKKAVQEATRKYRRSRFTDQHFRYVMRILEAADRDFFAGGLEYGWTKLNPIQIRAKCKEAYNKQIETDDEIISIFTEISRSQSQQSQQEESTSHGRARGQGIYSRLVEKDETIGIIYPGICKSRSQRTRQEESSILGEKSLITDSPFTPSPTNRNKTDISGQPSEGQNVNQGPEKKKRLGFLARLIKRKSRKDMPISSAAPRNVSAEGGLSENSVCRRKNAIRKNKELHDDRRWVIKADSSVDADSTLAHSRQERGRQRSRREARNSSGRHNMRMAPRLSSTQSSVRSIDIIKDLEDEESRRDNKTSSEPEENEVRGLEKATQQNNGSRESCLRVHRSGVQSEASVADWSTTAESRKRRHRLSSRRLAKGLGFTSMPWRISSTHTFAQSETPKSQPMELESRRDNNTSIESEERDARESNEATKDEFQVFAKVNTREAAEEGSVEESVMASSLSEKGATSSADIHCSRNQKSAKNPFPSFELCRVNFNICFNMNECDELEQVILEEYGGCCEEQYYDDFVLPVSTYREEFEA